MSLLKMYMFFSIMYYVVISSHNPNLDCFRGPALIEYLDHLSLTNSSQDADKPVRMPIVDRYKVSVTDLVHFFILFFAVAI